MDGGVTGWARHGGCVMNSHHLSGTVFRRTSCQPEPTPGDSRLASAGHARRRGRGASGQDDPVGDAPPWWIASLGIHASARDADTDVVRLAAQAGRAASKLSW